MRYIIRTEKKKFGDSIPVEPPLNLPPRKRVGVMGTLIDFVKELDEKYLSNEGEFKKKADAIRQSREEKGEANVYARMQPFHRPELHDLVGRRIDVYVPFGSAGLRWCQGEVLYVVEDARDPTVYVDWDPCPELDDYKERSEGLQVLRPTKWNKDIKNAWRMDVNIAVGEVEDCTNDNNNEEEEITMNECESDSEYDSEDVLLCDLKRDDND